MPDVILYWNAVALEADRISHTREPQEQAGPTLSSRALAIVHLAMYDAYSAINPAARHPNLSGPPYLPGLPTPPPGALAPAAAAGAAYTALSALYPSQQNLFDTALGQGGNPLDPGHAFGMQVAQALLMDRRRDPDASAGGYVPSLARGKHRVDPDNPTQGYHGPFYGARSPGFAITVRHVLNPPPLPQSSVPTYLSALREVRGLGIAPELMGTLPNTVGGQPIPRRTIDQTLRGIYWAYDGAVGLGTPPRLYNQLVRRLAMARRPSSATTPNTEAENARLFALVNAAMGDAGILAWDQKYIHDFWRPVVGIREHDLSMGPAATQADNDISNDTDTGWLPLGAPATNSKNPAFQQTPSGQTYPCNEGMDGMMKNFTPPFPAYPSGHATFGAAAFHITRRFYGVASGNRSSDPLFDGLDFVSDEFNGVNQDNRGTVRPRHLRHFPGGVNLPRGLWQMIIENALSRIYLGVHWSFDAFAVDANRNPVFGGANEMIGGVPLGLRIAEDIFNNGLTKSPVAPRHL